MKALTNKQTANLTQVTILASDGITLYTGIAPRQISLNMNANDTQRD